MSFKLVMLAGMYMFSAGMFIFSGGSLFSGRFNQGKKLGLAAGVVAFAMTLIFWRDVYNWSLETIVDQVEKRVTEKANNTESNPAIALENVSTSTEAPLDTNKAPDIVKPNIVGSDSTPSPITKKTQAKSSSSSSSSDLRTDIKSWVEETKIMLSGRGYKAVYYDKKKLIISCSSAGGIEVWDRNTTSKVFSYEGDGTQITDLTVNNERGLAAFYNNHHILIIDLDELKIVQQIPSEKRVDSLAFAPDGKSIGIGTGDGSVVLIDLSKQTEIRNYLGLSGRVSSISFSPNGKEIAAASTPFGFGPNSKRVLKIWDKFTEKLQFELVGETGVPKFVFSFSPDGNFIAVSSHSGAKVYKARSGEMLREFSIGKGPVNSVNYSPDGTELIIGGYDNITKKPVIAIFNVFTGIKISELIGHTSAVYHAEFMDDGNRVVSSSGTYSSGEDDTIRLWRRME